MPADKLPSLGGTPSPRRLVTPLPGGSGAGPRFRIFVHSGMMKQILLCVAAMFTKIVLRKCAELPCRDPFVSREILLSQNTLDPDIDRKGAQTFIGKEHHTIGDLRADTRKVAEVCAKIGIRK